jgi:cobalt-zinc-cadmium efflux system protein
LPSLGRYIEFVMPHVHPHTSVTSRKLTLAMAVNLVITIAEFVGGWVSGYLALQADAVHNLSDVAALVLAWLGVKGAQLPATKTSTYGYKRLEVMIAFISAVSLVVIAVFIFIEAYHRLMSPQPITHPWLFMTVAAIGLCGNLASVFILASERGKSLNLRTAYLHMAYDTASSIVVLIGGVVILLTGLVVIDVILTTAIALAIFWSSYLVIKEAVIILLEAVPGSVQFDEVLSALCAVPRVRDVHDLHIWALSSNEIALSCHVCLDDDDYLNGMDFIQSIDALLRNRFGIGHATIQLEKADCARNDLLCRYHERP